MDEVMDYAVKFATGDFAYSAELQAFWMAVQGAMAVRAGPNRNRTLHWFHSFALSVLAGFSGGWFGFVWMAKPTSMLSSDINMAACIVAYILVNYLPLDLGYLFCNTLPVTLVTTSFAQLFRSLGIMKFVTVCFEAFKDNPSPYYPIPVFGPIMYATLLGNMGGFVMKGIEGHFQNGMPWPVQNGLFCASFYHFFVNDTDGPIGTFLRATIPVKDLLGLDDKQFAAVVVTFFMQVVGILQLPAFLGPKFSPFGMDILNPWKDSSTWEVGKGESAYSKEREATSSKNGNGQKKKNNRRKTKKDGNKVKTT